MVLQIKFFNGIKRLCLRYTEAVKTYITVHVVATNPVGEILILQRAEGRLNPGKWDVVTGYIQDRESAEEAALRELKEETNLKGIVSKTADPIWVDENETRWVDIAVLVKVKDISKLKIDRAESQSLRWIMPSDLVVAESPGI